jgi:DNA polymerase I-like protein with 3'-5' exonuclease and polymerase domains
MASWRERDGTIKSTFGTEYEQGELVEVVQGADFLIAHNSKFELGWLRRCGLDLRKVIVWDTMIAEHVLGGNRFYPQQLSLKASLKRHALENKTDLIGMMFDAGIDTQSIPESWLKDYCEQDVKVTHALFEVQRQRIFDRGFAPHMYQRCLVTPCLADIESNGMQLDEQAVESLLTEMEEDYAKETSELMDFCEGAEPTSSKQLVEFVYGTLGFIPPRDYRGKSLLTPAGRPSVSADVLERLRPTNKRQQEFLDRYRQWSQKHSDVTKYLRKFRECCRQAGGALRAVFNQCSTRTHRLSSSGLEWKVQFQNFNRKFKPLFRARHAGWLVAEADGAQLEFRVGAHLGRDPVALRDIITGRDVHSYAAKMLSTSRDEAKAHTFKPMYGGTSGAPAEREYYDYFTKRYQGISGTQRQWALGVLASQFLDTEWGFRFYYPGTKLKESGWIVNQTNIYNYPVQSFATAEIIPCALVCAWHRMREMESFMVNTVHDSIIAELHPEEVGLWHDVAKQCLIVDSYKMIRQLYGVELTVPLGAGVIVGDRWASKEAKAGEVVYEADESLWMEAAKKENMI